MAYRIFVTPKAQRQIKELDRPVQDRIRTAIRALREDPFPQGTKKLKASEGLYRIRVGDYRIVYAVEAQLLLLVVVTVGHRREAYDLLPKKYSRNICGPSLKVKNRLLAGQENGGSTLLSFCLASG